MKKLCEKCMFFENGKCNMNHVPLPKTVSPYIEDLKETEFVIKFPGRGKQVKRSIKGKLDIFKIGINDDTIYCWGGLPKIENLINALEFLNDLEEGE